MKESTYKYNLPKILWKSGFIWLIALAHFSFAVASVAADITVLEFILFHIFLSVFSVPGLVIFFNYFNAIKQGSLTVASNSLTYENNGETTVIKLEGIVKIKVVDAHKLDVPWKNHHCYKLIDKEGRAITLNSYLVILKDLGFSANIVTGASINLEKLHKLLPLMKNLD